MASVAGFLICMCGRFKNRKLDSLKTINIHIMNEFILPKGFPTHTTDITGMRICLGDKVTYDFDDNTCSFIVVFELNAFRKKYKDWDKTIPKPLLEYGNMAKRMRIKVIKHKKIGGLCACEHAHSLKECINNLCTSCNKNIIKIESI